MKRVFAQVEFLDEIEDLEGFKKDFKALVSAHGFEDGELLAVAYRKCSTPAARALANFETEKLLTKTRREAFKALGEP